MENPSAYGTINITYTATAAQIEALGADAEAAVIQRGLLEGIYARCKLGRSGKNECGARVTVEESTEAASVQVQCPNCPNPRCVHAAVAELETHMIKGANALLREQGRAGPAPRPMTLLHEVAIGEEASPLHVLSVEAVCATGVYQYEYQLARLLRKLGHAGFSVESPQASAGLLRSSELQQKFHSYSPYFLIAEGLESMVAAVAQHSQHHNVTPFGVQALQTVYNQLKEDGFYGPPADPDNSVVT